LEENKGRCSKTIRIKKTWNDFEFEVNVLAEKIRGSGIEISNIFGVPRGGLIVAVRLSHLLDKPLIVNWHEEHNDNTLIVDDVVDSGKTLSSLACARIWKVAALYWNPSASFQPHVFAFRKDNNSWIVFPWEAK
jgi:hypoxanthine phosphoribosyltransferase